MDHYICIMITSFSLKGDGNIFFSGLLGKQFDGPDSDFHFITCAPQREFLRSNRINLTVYTRSWNMKKKDHLVGFEI